MILKVEKKLSLVEEWYFIVRMSSWKWIRVKEVLNEWLSNWDSMVLLNSSC